MFIDVFTRPNIKVCHKQPTRISPVEDRNDDKDEDTER